MNSIMDILIKELGLDAEFDAKLREGDDDWSMVIKAHALVESLVTQVILFHLQRPELTEFVSRLLMRDKLRMLDALHPGCIQPPQRRIIDELGSLRNRLVHNVQRTSFSFEVEYATDAQRQEFTALCLGMFGSVERINRAKAVLPPGLRFTMWFGVMDVATSIRMAIQSWQMKQQSENAKT